MHRMEIFRTFRSSVLLFGCLAPAWACTIFEFADSGFAANAIHLMHAVPIFDGNNGTFFLDNTQVSVCVSTESAPAPQQANSRTLYMAMLLQFAYKCSEGGGWHDFFAYQNHLVPWSPAKERAGGEQCNRLNFRGVDDVLHVNLHAGWEPYNSAGVSQVRA